jgi:hypothetical protein
MKKETEQVSPEFHTPDVKTKPQPVEVTKVEVKDKMEVDPVSKE